MQTILASKQTSTALPLLFKLSLTIKNLIFILAALVSFILWFSAALQTPERIERVENALHNISSRQDKLEGQIILINQDTKTIKNILLNRSIKNDK